jgi:hypothetical protein
MFSLLAVPQDVLVLTPGPHQGVREQGQVREVAVFVNAPGEGDDFRCPPGRRDGHGTEWERAKEVAEHSGSEGPLNEVGFSSPEVSLHVADTTARGKRSHERGSPQLLRMTPAAKL